MAPSRSVAKYLADELPGLGVTHVFELVGGMITVLLDALHANPDLTVISMHHEQGAGFAAEGFARESGRPAVAMATSGPGATNLLTAVGSCYFDSVPAVFITGQVNRSEMRHEGVGRQGGFQETDIVSMAIPITKRAIRVTSADEFPRLLREAFQMATSGRPGPVLIDVPMDVQRADVPAGSTSSLLADSGDLSDAEHLASRNRFLNELAEALGTAERPLILAGGGVRTSGAVAEFRELVDHLAVPVVVSLMGLDALPVRSPWRAGFLGSYGNRWANWALAESDLLLVLGSRLDVRQTGSDVEGFRGSRSIFHVDVDPTELNNHVPGCRVLDDGLATFLTSAISGLHGGGDAWAGWMADIKAKEREWPDIDENVPDAGMNPNEVVRLISSTWTDVAAFVTDVGQHQMWAAQSIGIAESQRFLTSGGMGSMGFGLPAAIGAALAEGDSPVCLIAGDGGFQCNIQELQTAFRLGVQLRAVIFDNGSLGMVRQFQESYFEGRYYSTKWGYSAPDFCGVAEAYGVSAHHAETYEDLVAALATIRTEVGGPSLLHVRIDGDLNVYPKMAFGQPFGSMEPLVAPLEMEGT